MTIKEWREDFKSYINELDIPKDDYNGIIEYIDDGYALMKEQDVQSVLSNRVCEVEPLRYVRKGFCPNCHQEMEWLFNRKYCGFCGQVVKWE